MTYDSTDKVLFSADAFGKFGALDIDAEWDCEARRYYIGIVGKYGRQVQALLKKAATLDIAAICPLHGPVLSTAEEITHAIGQYLTWSSYGVESEGVCLAYTSVYGHTKAAADITLRVLTKLIIVAGKDRIKDNTCNSRDGKAGQRNAGSTDVEGKTV